MIRHEPLPPDWLDVHLRKLRDLVGARLLSIYRSLPPTQSPRAPFRAYLPCIVTRTGGSHVRSHCHRRRRCCRHVCRDRGRRRRLILIAGTRPVPPAARPPSRALGAAGALSRSADGERRRRRHRRHAGRRPGALPGLRAGADLGRRRAQRQRKVRLIARAGGGAVGGRGGGFLLARSGRAARHAMGIHGQAPR